MKQLLISSTWAEALSFPVLSDYQDDLKDGAVTSISAENDLLITGVGSPSVILHLTRLLSKRSYSRIIQIGLAGSYKEEIVIGNVVAVHKDRFADLGIDDRGSLKTLEEIELGNSPGNPSSGWLPGASLATGKIMPVTGITVNTSTGSRARISLYKEKFDPDIESMEGAALFLVAHSFNIPAVQIRAISNYVTERDRDQWDIPLALKSLAGWLGLYL